MSSKERKNSNSVSSDDSDKEPEYRPSRRPTIPPTSRHLRTNRNFINQSHSNETFDERSEQQSSGADNTGDASIVEISSSMSDEANETFRSLESLSNFSEDEFYNPFSIFPLIFVEPPKQIKMANNSIPLSFINSIAKLGEPKDGKSNNNWTSWSENIRSILTLQDLWVEVTKPLADLNDHENKKCEKAFHIINLAVSDGSKSLIRGLNNSVAAWVALKNHYNKPTVVNKVAIVRKIVNEKLMEADDLEGHVLRMKSHFQALEDLGEKWSQPMNIAFLLQSLSEEFDPLVSSIGAFEEKDISMERVVSSLMDEFKRRKSLSLTKAMQSLTFNAGVACGLCRNVGHGPSTCGLKTKPVRHCKFCNKFGHVQSECYSNPQRKVNQQASNGNSKKQQHFDNNRRRVNRGNKAETLQSPDDKEFENLDEPESASSARSFCYNASNVPQKQKNRRKQKKNIFKRLGSPIDKKKIEIFSKDPNPLKRKRKNSSSSYSSGSIRISPSNINLELKQNDSNFSDDNTLEIQCNNDIYEDLNKINELYSDFCFTASVKQFQKHPWIVDSGATSHMCSDQNLFQNLKYDDDLGFVRIADGKNYPIKGIGTINLWLKHNNDPILFKLDNVNFVPQFDTNLISVNKLTKQGMSITFDKLGCHAVINETYIELATYLRNGYILNESQDLHVARPCIHEWHKRMAHKNIANIKYNKNRLGLSISKCTCIDDCIPCIQGKLTALPFPKHAQKPTNSLEVVVSDVCGQMPVQSLGKSKYFITFVDIFSDYTEVVSIRNKSDAKQCIINYIERLKNAGKQKPITFRSDNGGEYIDKHLIDYLEKEGIKIEHTVHDCPQQNGISERKNRTLCDAVRTMLKSAKLPPSLWAEALANAVYTFNRIPRTGMERSPIEMFSGKLRTPFFIEFGAPVFVATKAHGRKKLDDRAKLMRFLSVDEQSKGFRLWDGRSVRVERNVRFFNSKGGNLSFDKLYCETPITNPINQPNEESDNVQNSPSSHAVEPRRSTRLIEQQKDKAAAVIDNLLLEPKTYKQALNSLEKDKWLIAMKEELQSIKDNSTWSVVDLPQGRKAIGSKWVYKLKRDSSGNIAKYKARLVAQGFTQRYGIDYDEVFAPVARSTTFRTLLSIAGKNKLFVKQYDVKTAFLNGRLDEEIYMKPPQGMDIGTKVFKLHKSIYGLKQAARVWNNTLHKGLIDRGFTQSKSDSCLYVKRSNNDVCLLIVHVDDIVFASNTENNITEVINALRNLFEIKDLGDIKNFLNIDIHRESDGSFSMSQTRYIHEIANEAGLADAKSQKYPLDPGYHKLQDNNLLDNNQLYRKLIGMLLYVSTNTRPDVAASVPILSQKVEKPRELDLNEVKRVIKYLKSTHNLRLNLSPNPKQTLIAFSDADWAEDRETRKSIGGIICMLHGGTISWSSRKQNLVSISSTESEYYALSETVREIKWLTNLLNDFGINIKDPIEINCDSQSCIKMLENDKFSNRTKHIDVRCHHIKESIRDNQIKLKYCPSEDNIADMLTKPLAGTKLTYLRKLAELKENLLLNQEDDLHN